MTEPAQNDSLPKYRYFVLVDEIAPRIINQHGKCIQI